MSYTTILLYHDSTILLYDFHIPYYTTLLHATRLAEDETRRAAAPDAAGTIPYNDSIKQRTLYSVDGGLHFTYTIVVSL